MDELDEQDGQQDQAAPDPEEQFPPRPGGLVDQARRQKAREHAPQQSATAAVDRRPRPVLVKIRQPEQWGARTVTVAAGASAMAMPADPLRKRGKVNLLTASASVLIARDRSAADSGTGYTLQSGQPPEEIGHTREVWLNNPGAGAVQVSIFTESYED